MRSFRFSPAAVAALNSQIDYLISKHALQAARTLERRVREHIVNTLCHFPYAGTHIPDRDVFESWVPGTRIVVWYTVAEDHITIAMIWHTAQDRQPGDRE